MLVSLVCLYNLLCCCLVRFYCWIHMVGFTCAKDVWVYLAILGWRLLHCMIYLLLYHIVILHNLRPLGLMQTGGCSLFWMLDVLHVWFQVFCWGRVGSFIVFSSWFLLVSWWSCCLVECLVCFLVLGHQVKLHFMLHILVQFYVYY